jgi:hypothetical protein
MMWKSAKGGRLRRAGRRVRFLAGSVLSQSDFESRGQARLEVPASARAGENSLNPCLPSTATWLNSLLLTFQASSQGMIVVHFWAVFPKLPLLE